MKMRRQRIACPMNQIAAPLVTSAPARLPLVPLSHVLIFVILIMSQTLPQRHPQRCRVFGTPCDLCCSISRRRRRARPTRSLQYCCRGFQARTEYLASLRYSISTFPACTGGALHVHSTSRHEIGNDLVISRKLAASAAVY